MVDATATTWFARSWAFVPIGVSLVAVAFLINLFMPKSRYRIRRVLLLYGFYLLTLGVHFALHLVGWKEWADRVQIVAALLEAVAVINLVALTVFELALPAIRIDVVSIISDLIVGLAYVVTVMWILKHDAEWDLSSVVATSAVIGGVLSLSLQATLGNILGGVALQLDGSVHVGDWLQLPDGMQGKVREIRWRHTVVETRNFDTIIVPNANLLAQNIMILGKRDGKQTDHRMWVYFNVDFRFPPTHVIEVVDAALQAAPIEGVAADPKP